MTRLSMKIKASNSSTSALIPCGIKDSLSFVVTQRGEDKKPCSSFNKLSNNLGVFYYELKYGSTKGTVTAGNLLVRDFNAYYSSETIDSEIVGTGPGTSFSSSLDYTQIRPGTVQVFGGSVSGVDNGSEVITGTGVSGTIDYSTGAISLSFTSSVTGDVTATYKYNMECNSNIPQVNIDISLVEVRATTRKLKALWCSEAQI